MELINIIMRSRNCDEQTANEWINKHAETIEYYSSMNFSAQYIYDVINDKL